MNEILRSPDTRAALAKLNALLRPGTPQDFASFVAAETPKWAEMTRSSGAKAQ